MAFLTSAAVRKQIAAGKLDPIYLLLGGDETEKTALAGEFISTIEEELRPFNVDRFFGTEASPTSIVDAARTLPLMAPQRVVVVLQAEHAIVPRRETQASEEGQDVLTSYVKAPATHACLVLVAGELDERRSLSKLLLKSASVVRCDGLGNPVEAAKWLREKAESHGLTIDAKAVQLFINRAAGDPMRLRADAERLVLYAAGQKVITTADVEALTTDARQGSGEWAVTNAIERGAAAVALRELAAQFDAGVSPFLILGQVAWCVRTKLDRRRVPGAVEAVFQTDLALKSSGGDPRVLLERLVVELCGGPAAGR
ncbi:MAG TPA: DNA polymerase III subunit delta [Vicinamibacterales bacterium]